MNQANRAGSGGPPLFPKPAHRRLPGSSPPFLSREEPKLPGPPMPSRQALGRGVASGAADPALDQPVGDARRLALQALVDVVHQRQTVGIADQETGRGSWRERVGPY